MLGAMLKFIVILGFLALDHLIVSATLEQQITVGIGKTVFLPCSTKYQASVDWQYHHSPFESPKRLYSNDIIYDGVPKRYSVPHPTPDNYTLTIKDAEPGDTGLYTCIEDGGTKAKHTISLLVTDNPSPPPDTSSYGGVAIVLGIIALILLICVVVLAVFLYRQCKKRPPTPPQIETTLELSHVEQVTKQVDGDPNETRQSLLPHHGAPEDQSDVGDNQQRDESPPTPRKADHESIDIGPPSFSHVLSTEPGNEVRGVCVLGPHLYVACSPQITVDIYDAKTLKKLEEKLVLSEDHPCCMALCPINKCLYITYYRSMNIQKIIVDGKPGTQWKAFSQPDGISVAPSTHVIVALREVHKLIEFRSDGQELRKINLEQKSPRHPIPFGNDYFLVCFGVISQSPCEVHLVDKDGHSVEKVTTKTQHPLHLTVDSRGYVYVADFSVNHVTMLDKDLKYLGEVISAHETKVDVPFRLCFNESCDRLYVGEYGGQRRVMAFDNN